MHLLEQRSIPEISTATGLSAGAISGRYTRMKEKLILKLNAYTGAEYCIPD